RRLPCLLGGRLAGMQTGSLVHSLAAPDHVLMERATGGGRLPSGDFFDDVVMLVRGQWDRARLAQRRSPIEVQLVDEAPGGEKELGISRQLDQPIVKREVDLMIRI